LVGTSIPIHTWVFWMHSIIPNRFGA
jgi:hypothetical protein